MKLLLITSFAALCILFSACKKDDIPHNYGTAGNYTTMEAIFQSLAPASRTASVSVSSGGSLYAPGGSRIIFPPNAFITASGADAKGSVQVTVNDWLRKGDMVFGNMLPITADGQPLRSGGEAYVDATQNGQPVYLKPGKQLQINLPQFGNPAVGMQLFRGALVDSLAGGVGWNRSDTSRDTSSNPVPRGIVYQIDTISVFADSMRYWNADMLLSSLPSTSYQSFNIQVSSPVSNFKSYCAYVLFDKHNAAWRFYNASPSATSFSVSKSEDVLNIPSHFVVMGISNGNFYAGITAATPTDGKTYTVTLSQMDPGTLKQQLNGL